MKGGFPVSYGRTLAVTALAALMLGAVAAGTVDGIAAAREARRAYRRDPAYVAPYPAPYYPYPNGYPYW